MSNSYLQAGWRTVRVLLLWGLLWGTTGPVDATAKPYVETEPSRGLHLFNRPKQKDAAAQWTYVRDLERRGKIKAASNQALALRVFWPYSDEAPAAQLLHARILEQRGQLQASFDAYQFLVEHYVGHFEFDAVIEAQMHLAKTLMEQRKGKFLFLPGFTAPERAIPLFEKIVHSAPEWRGAAEAYYLIGTAHERVYAYHEAIDAYFTTMNRFPDSAFSERAAYDQAQCHIKISKDAPNDKRAIETALASCDLYLQRYPASTHRTQIETDLQALKSQQIGNAYSLALYYDRILKKPESALIEYTEFVALYPNAPQAAEARTRIADLQPKPEK
jgi:tetratricopeptide (TPR) repeat protein